MAKKSLSFKDNISFYEAQLEEAKQELARLEKELSDHDVQTQRCRDGLDLLKAFLEGKPVNATSTKGATKTKISALDVNPETNRPKRGERRTQIKRICKKLGRGKKVFKTIEVLNELKGVESELSSGMKSYTYAVMNKFEEDGFVEKVGRGAWTLK